MKTILYLFFLTHFTYGLIFTVFGPLIPYLAEETGLIQSDFTYIFALRGVAYLIAGLSQKTILGHFCLYKRMLASCIISGIGFILFEMCYFHSSILAIVSFIMNLSIGSIEVLINVLLMEEVKDNPKQTMSFSYGLYGIGAVVGPIIVSLFGVTTLKICGVWTIFLGIIYYYALSLVRVQQQQKLTEATLLNSQEKIIAIPQKQTMNESTEKKFCYLFLLYAAITLSYRSWIPSFTVMEKIASKQSAALSISIYSGVLTVFRFMFTFLNPDTVTCLNYVSFILIGVLSISIFCYWIEIYFLVVFGSAVVLGIIFASYVPYLYALPNKYNKVFTPSNTFNTIIYYAIGQAIVSAIVGYLMQWIHPIMLFISLLFLSIVNKFLLTQTINSIQSTEFKNNLKEKELQKF